MEKKDFKSKKNVRKGSKTKKPTYNPRTKQRTGNETVDRNTDHAFNDPIWYFRYPELMNQAAKVPFVTKPGMSLKNILKVTKTADDTSVNYNLDVPGVYALNYVPSIGKSNDNTSPISQTAKNLYSAVRSNFSGTLAADAPDMVMQIVALDSIYSYIAWLKRVYRVLNTATPLNYTVPYGLLNAMGFSTASVKDLLANRLQLLTSINTLIRMANQFVCPNVFDIINRHYWMNDSVFGDAMSPSSQFYIFNPVGFNKFALVNTPDEVPAGGSVFTPLVFANTGGGQVVNSLYVYGLDLINALNAWEDCYNINGYFMKAFPGSQFVIEPLREDEVLEVKYSQQVLVQIHNSNVPVVATANFTIKQTISQDPSTNAIICNPTLTTTSGKDSTDYYGSNDNFILNLPVDLEPTPELIVEATRLITDYDYTWNEGPSTFTIGADCGTEFLVNRAVYVTDTTGNSYTGSFIAGLLTSYSSGTSTYTAKIAALNSWFDWSPMIYVGSGTDTITALHPLGDLQNVSLLSQQSFIDINRIALLSEFYSFE